MLNTTVSVKHVAVAMRGIFYIASISPNKPPSPKISIGILKFLTLC